MPYSRSIPRFLAGAAVALACTFTALAQNNRSFVSTTGSDTNNCSATAFCRTFPRALAVTNSGGEIIVVDSGGYGPATITQAVTISANGIVASITQTASDQSGLTINAPSGVVTINGLSIHGQGTGQSGILVQNVGTLLLSNITSEGFAQNGIEVLAGKISVEGSAFNRNGFNGIAIDSGQVAYVHNTTLTGNGTGMVLGTGTAIVADSSAKDNLGVGFQVGYNFNSSSGGTLDLTRVQSVANSVGLQVNTATSLLRVSYSVVTENGVNAYQIASGGSIVGTSPGSNVLIGSGTGTLGTATSLQ